jgi:hypothetical protein
LNRPINVFTGTKNVTVYTSLSLSLTSTDSLANAGFGMQFTPVNEIGKNLDVHEIYNSRTLLVEEFNYSQSTVNQGFRTEHYTGSINGTGENIGIAFFQPLLQFDKGCYGCN